ncbi:MAG: LacI family DNA-binding transcriptional regulator [Rhizobiales bacterium]|nr:LacI family DNA-binding transcriptional regulator [Hyphomicrobiales bacterium]
MSDVARLAGVTAMTVSRALKTPEKVSPETRKKVEEAVRRSGFVLNYAARSLVSQRSQIIVALFPTVMNSVFSGTIEGLSRLLAVQGYQLLLGETDFEIRTEETLLSGFIGWRPAGIVVTGSDHTVGTRAMLENADVPVVELWGLPKKPFDVSVGFSNVDAAYRMVHSLFEWGYRRIGFMSLDFPHNSRTIERGMVMRAKGIVRVPGRKGRAQIHSRGTTEYRRHLLFLGHAGRRRPDRGDPHGSACARRFGDRRLRRCGTRSRTCAVADDGAAAARRNRLAHRGCAARTHCRHV